MNRQGLGRRVNLRIDAKKSSFGGKQSNWWARLVGLWLPPFLRSNAISFHAQSKSVSISPKVLDLPVVAQKPSHRAFIVTPYMYCRGKNDREKESTNQLNS